MLSAPTAPAAWLRSAVRCGRIVRRQAAGVSPERAEEARHA